ncbi:uncharacterized protein LOC123301075 [Chrysoperla carnea]|uniref:uncharacterized protein LOC123301075 n=1 Tax=Chrysoperla carnea TaxID=189513 RepID=UPI001D09887E|nr:uncharacterized protein LOC123301075 [Chrysoperla carnea]
MRKYQQLVLIVVTIISVFLVVVYRNEYLRLRYVLEVLNFFGTPPKKEDILSLSKPHLSTWNPEPVWQKLDDNFYAYAAHKTENIGEIKVLAIGDNKIETVKLTCNLWFEDNDKPTIGKFSYVILSQGKIFNNYLFLCKQKQLKQVPYAISFANSPKIFIKNKNSLDKISQFTVCALPALNNFYDTQSIVDFISHNQVLGADEFIFYNDFISPKIQTALHRTSIAINASFTFFPWNIPNNKYENMQELITRDCLYRTAGRSKYVMIINLNEFIIPKYSSSLVTILNTLENVKDVHRFTIYVIKFCKALMRLKNILLNTRYLPYTAGEMDEFTVYTNINSDVHSETVQTRVVDMDTVVLNRYIKCNVKAITLPDSTAMNFAAHLNNAELKILYETGGFI